MGMLGLCDGDPVVEYLRSQFGANVVRKPRASLAPPQVVAARDGESKVMGQLADILTGPAPFVLPAEDLHVEPAPQVLGQRTRSVGLDLALEILGGFLQGFGVPDASLAGAFSRKSTVSFQFHDIRRLYVETNRLGRLLQHQSLDRTNPATRLYFEPDRWRLLLVDSVLTSPTFTISSGRSGGESAGIDLPTLQQVVTKASAKVDVSSSSSTEVTFSGQQPLAFAFTCLEVSFDGDGAITGLAGSDRKTTIQGLAERRPQGGRLAGVLLTDDPAMVDLDEPA